MGASRAAFFEKAEADGAEDKLIASLVGEAVKAIVVAKPGAATDAQAILDFTRTRIAGYKVPKTIDFVDVLPRNATGKVLKRELRKPFWEGRERQVN